MSVQIFSIDEVRVVTKPWGHEKWIAHGEPDFKYALKEIFIRAPHRSSIQFHKDKQESNYIQSGRGVLHYSVEPIDMERYLAEDYSQEELDALVDDMVQKELVPGTVFHIRPGYLHRVEAVEDLLMIESSTIELDDVLRLADDSGRGHGRIGSEHKS